MEYKLTFGMFVIEKSLVCICLQVLLVLFPMSIQKRQKDPLKRILSGRSVRQMVPVRGLTVNN